MSLKICGLFPTISHFINVYEPQLFTFQSLCKYSDLLQEYFIIITLFF